MADFSMETLYHPPFENDPPVKLNISAKTLGLVLAILYAILALFSVIGVFGAIGVSALGAALGVREIFVLVILGAVVAAIAHILVAFGGYKMYQLDAGGRRLVIMGLALAVVADIIGAIGSYSPVGIIGSIIINGIVYYLVIISRFPDEAPLVTSGGAGTPPPAV